MSLKLSSEVVKLSLYVQNLLLRHWLTNLWRFRSLHIRRTPSLISSIARPAPGRGPGHNHRLRPAPRV